MREIGLTSGEIAQIRAVFQNAYSIKKVILFGSRAKGTYQRASDIDLAISGIENELEIQKIADRLDQLPLPWKFDVKALDSISHAPLLEHIQRVGIVFYSRPDVASSGQIINRTPPRSAKS